MRRKIVHTVVLMSGGLDSFVVGHLLCANGHTIWPIYVMRGASAEKYEVAALKKIVRWLATSFPGRVKAIKFVPLYYPPKILKKPFPKSIQKDLGYPGREAVLAYCAIFYAVERAFKIKNPFQVATGSLAKDLFAHNSKQYWNQFSKLLDLELGSKSIPMIHPLQRGYFIGAADKRKVVRYARTHGMPIKWARSCVRGSTHPCMKCLECKQRMFAESS